MRVSRASRWLTTTLAVVLISVLALSACGRKGPPKHPDGSTYPETYPQE